MTSGGVASPATSSSQLQQLRCPSSLRHWGLGGPEAGDRQPFISAGPGSLQVGRPYIPEIAFQARKGLPVTSAS